MRVVKEIPHPRFKITIYSWNGKYLIKIELGQFEQVYKLNELDVSSPDDLTRILDENFQLKVMKRFSEMASDFNEAYQTIK